MKVAKWEIKRNLKNKSFIIGLFLTPVLFLTFFFIPDLLNKFTEKDNSITFFVNDELNIVSEFNHISDENGLTNWEIIETDLNEAEAKRQLLTDDNHAYIHLTEQNINDGVIPLYTSEKINNMFYSELIVFEQTVKQHQMLQHGFTDDQLALISQHITFETMTINEKTENEISDTHVIENDPIERLVPGMFAGIILFSILISGMMIFQSASQEKKEKIAEIILSSITPNELMQGKIIGYFVLGIVQVFIWLGIALPIITWKSQFPIFKYLFVPELIVLLVIALLGYLLFAALFVGIGSTIEDVSTSGNFQGLVLMLPFLPIIFIGPVIADPNGIIAKVASFIPFTSPAVLIVRLSILEMWPWGEILTSIVVLIVMVWLFMKLAGKIFQTGILLYGKNATPKEIWKWLWI